MPTIHQVDDDQVVAFQDEGTGASDAYRDPVSAGTFAGSYWEGGFVHHGLEIVVGSGSIGINRGVAFLEYTGAVTVQTNPRGSYDREWRGPTVFPVSIPSVSNLSLDEGEENDVYIKVDLSEGNHIEYHVGHDISVPSPPRLKIATVDEPTGDRIRHNDWKSAESRYSPRDVRDLKVGPDEVGVKAYHNGSGGNTEGPAIWRGDKFVSLVDSTTIE